MITGIINAFTNVLIATIAFKIVVVTTLSLVGAFYVVNRCAYFVSNTF